MDMTHVEKVNKDAEEIQEQCLKKFKTCFSNGTKIIDWFSIDQKDEVKRLINESVKKSPGIYYFKIDMRNVSNDFLRSTNEKNFLEGLKAFWGERKDKSSPNYSKVNGRIVEEIIKNSKYSYFNSKVALYLGSHEEDIQARITAHIEEKSTTYSMRLSDWKVTNVKYKIFWHEIDYRDETRFTHLPKIYEDYLRKDLLPFVGK